MKSILIDFGGTLARDNILYHELALKSGNLNPANFTPSSWDKIETVGSVNYFEASKNKFFEMSKLYDGGADFIRKFTSSGSFGKSTTIVIFDNKPHLNLDFNSAQLLLCKKLYDEGCSPNSVYIESDKVAVAKKYSIDYAIDDDPRVALALASAGVKTFLISRLWNRKFDLELLDIMIPDKKKDVILKNLAVVEDWFEISRLLVV